MDNVLTSTSHHAETDTSKEDHLLASEEVPSDTSGQGPQCDAKKLIKAETTLAKGMKSYNSPENAARERSRVKNLREAFHNLQAALPSVPPNTKLSKLDILILATNYIAHLTDTLDQSRCFSDHTFSRAGGYLHPVKKWPMRSLLYCGNTEKLQTGIPVDEEMSVFSQDS
ncbi:transcription factor 23 [Engraulis encrasicolus]|uniref:transcription factor 23 n=1 Tax=Engraulis encrasicolus TaxID=184585 RepID=UPI002FD46692